MAFKRSIEIRYNSYRWPLPEPTAWSETPAVVEKTFSMEDGKDNNNFIRNSIKHTFNATFQLTGAQKERLERMSFHRKVQMFANDAEGILTQYDVRMRINSVEQYNPRMKIAGFPNLSLYTVNVVFIEF